MRWNEHLELKGKHSILSPSAVSWINYTNDDMAEKLTNRYYAYLRTPMGTALHDFAAVNISLREKISTKSKRSLIHLIKLFLKARQNEKGEQIYPESLVNFCCLLPDHVYETLVLYINDCIGFRMEPEVGLKYSDNCFGTTDAISFQDNILRISDLKTGDTPGHMEQLFIYAALYCLEYHFKPQEIKIETRLYQFGDVTEAIDIPPNIIAPIMDRIIASDNYIESLKKGE